MEQCVEMEAESRIAKFSSDHGSQQVALGFWSRNFLWICPLAVLVVGGLVVYFGGFWKLDLMEQPAEASLKYLSNAPEVVNKIGVPLEVVDSEIPGRFEMRAHREFALMDGYRIKGPKGIAKAYGTMVRTNNGHGWTLWQLAIDFSDGETIRIPEKVGY